MQQRREKLVKNRLKIERCPLMHKLPMPVPIVRLVDHHRLEDFLAPIDQPTILDAEFLESASADLIRSLILIADRIVLINVNKVLFQSISCLGLDRYLRAAMNSDEAKKMISDESGNSHRSLLVKAAYTARAA